MLSWSPSSTSSPIFMLRVCLFAQVNVDLSLKTLRFLQQVIFISLHSHISNLLFKKTCLFFLIYLPILFYNSKLSASCSALPSENHYCTPMNLSSL